MTAVPQSATGPTLSERLAGAALRSGDRAAVRSATAQLSYRQLDRTSAQMAGLLGARGLARGDRVGLMLPNTPAFAAAYHGILRAGGVVVPMSPLLRAREVGTVLAHSGARLLVLWHHCPDGRRIEAAARGVDIIRITSAWLAEVEDTPVPAWSAADPDDLAQLLYSSGTSGEPKAVELSHCNLAAAAEATAASMHELLDDAPILVAAPLFHGYGLGCGLNASLVAGASITVLQRFDADAALDLIERERTTIFLGVPTMFVRMLRSHRGRPRDLSSLTTCLSGGGALRPDLLEECERDLGAEMLEGYGVSEMLRIAVNRPGDRRAGSVGRSLDGVELELRDDAGRRVPAGGVGEVVVRGPSVMRGYWRSASETARVLRDGWLHTGDLGRLDADGRIWIVGRKRDIIIRGGYNVFPGEVESALAEHPAVTEAAVVGIPDDEVGEEVAAAVVLADRATDIPVGELLDWARGRLAPHKRPRLLWTVDALPRGVTGKVLREPLRAAARAHERGRRA